MSDTTTIALGSVAAILVIYAAMSMGNPMSAPATLGSRRKTRPRATLGAKNKNKRRQGLKGCENVAIDSPDFERCATLGAGRSVLPGKPTRVAHNLNTGFVQDNFTPVGQVNPFEKKITEDFVKDDFLGATTLEDSTRKISRAGGQAFPFSQSTTHGGVKPQTVRSTPSVNTSGKVTPPPRSSSRSTLTLGTTSTTGEGVKFSTAFLGSAVSPSESLGASQEEIVQSSQQLPDINVVQKTNGGQLNLLVHS